MHLAAGQGRFQHVARIHAAFTAANAHHGVQLVQEQDDLTASLLHLVDDRLEPLLELAPELGSGHHGRQVQGHHAPVLQRVGDIADGDALCQTFRNGGLPHAGLTDYHRVVLAAPGQRLHDLPDFQVAPHHGVQLPLPGHCSEIDAALFQRAIPAFRIRVVDPVPAAYLGQSPVHPLPVYAVGPKYPRRFSVGFRHGCDEQVLGTDELVVETSRLLTGALQQPLCPWSRVDLVRFIGQFGGGLQGPVQHRADVFRRAFSSSRIRDGTPSSSSRRARRICSTSHWLWRWRRTNSWEFCNILWAWLVKLLFCDAIVLPPCTGIRVVRISGPAGHQEP